MKDIIDQLKERGFIDNMTDGDLHDLLKTPQKIYCGFDPTAESLHLGNLVGIICLAWFERAGHTPVAIVGGATGMVGDPSGKSHERPLLDEETIQRNLNGIRKNIEAVLSKPVVLNNYDWFKNFSFLGFLRDVGKHFRMGPMLSKDSVKQRLISEEGMSFTEFSYQLLQGYDFYHLNQNEGVTIQIGGSDQWGNITAGTELTRKLTGASVHGITFPLITRSDGKKFGKSESGAVWLSPDKLSPYEFYQYLFKIPDADLGKLFRMLTFLDIEEILKIEKGMKEPGYQPNSAQKRLAEEVTRLVHGEEGLAKALKATAAAAPGADAKLDADTLEQIAKDLPNFQSTEGVGEKLIDLIVNLGIKPSKSEVRRLIEGGGVSINNEIVQDPGLILNSTHLIDGKLMLIALGKKNKVLVRIGKN